VLGAKLHPQGRDPPRGLAQVHKGRTDHDLNLPGPLTDPGQVLGQLLDEPQRAVHLPIADYQGLAHDNPEKGGEW